MNTYAKVHLWAVIAIMASTVMAAACRPAPGEDYDSVATQGIAIGRADVISTNVRTKSPSVTCFGAEYSGIESIFGTLPEAFSVNVCMEGFSPEELEDYDVVDEWGFVSEATVLIGIVPDHTEESGFRYAQPTCWGPLHLRLDTMSEDEQSEVLDAVRSWDYAE